VSHEKVLLGNEMLVERNSGISVGLKIMNQVKAVGSVLDYSLVLCDPMESDCKQLLSHAEV
jgi:hypothetical protein